MRGRRRTMAMEGGGSQRLFQGDAELGIVILEHLQIVPGLIWRHPTLGVIEINDLFGVVKLAVDVVKLAPQVMLQRRRGMATPSGLVPLVRLTTWEANLSWRRCWRPEEEARGSEEADEGLGATS